MTAVVAPPTTQPSSNGRVRVSRGARYSAILDPPASPPTLSSFESAFQLQEYLAQLIKYDPHDIEAIVNVPTTTVNTGTTDGSASGDVQEVDRDSWIYEQIRRLAQDLASPLINLLQLECDRSTCPEMKAGEWLYLCVAHGNGSTMEQCCAIDYALHTLDAATALLCSPRFFPSRISVPSHATRHFSSLARRLSRIFAHAYFHHREAFEQAEAENALYERFLGLVREFQLVPQEFLVIPWESRPPRVPKVVASDTLIPPPVHSSPRSSPDQQSQDLSRSPGGLGRKRTDTMYFSGDFNVLDANRSPSLDEAVAAREELGDDDGLLQEVSLDDAAAAAARVSSNAQPAVPVSIQADSTFFDDLEDEAGNRLNEPPAHEEVAPLEAVEGVTVQDAQNPDTVPDVESVVTATSDGADGPANSDSNGTSQTGEGLPVESGEAIEKKEENDAPKDAHEETK